jgi:hypothetical protein
MIYIAGFVSHVAGSISKSGYEYMDGPATQATFKHVRSITSDGHGSQYILDSHKLRKVSNGKINNHTFFILHPQFLQPHLALVYLKFYLFIYPSILNRYCLYY